MPSVNGVVLNADETSFKLDDGNWYKYSKQVKPAPKRAAVGQTVSVAYTDSEYNGKQYHWANSVTVAEGASAAPGSPSANGTAPGSYAYRDISIGRQSSLKTAVEFLRLRFETQVAAKGIVEPLTESDVLATADRFEAYIRHEDEPPEPTGYGGDPGPPEPE